MVYLFPPRCTSTNQTIWLVVDDNYVVVKPIKVYISYLLSSNKSPNTIKAYAYNLKLYWDYLERYALNWQLISLDDLAGFILWLRSPEYHPKLVSIEQKTAKRTEKTVSDILSTVYRFIEFHQRNGNITGTINTVIERQTSARKFKGFLHQIAKSKTFKGRFLNIKKTKIYPKYFSCDEVTRIVNACTNRRDKFLFCLLYESGIRIGEALSLRHSDIVSDGKRNILKIIPRRENRDTCRVKNSVERVIDIPISLARLYFDYYVYDYPNETDCDYVFVSLYSPSGTRGTPFSYKAVEQLCRTLEKRTGIVKITPHMFRHTHATELLKSGWNMSYVQKRLGHKSIQTTIDTYVHITEDDLAQEYQKYLKSRGN